MVLVRISTGMSKSQASRFHVECYSQRIVRDGSRNPVTRHNYLTFVLLGLLTSLKKLKIYIPSDKEFTDRISNGKNSKCCLLSKSARNDFTLV